MNIKKVLKKLCVTGLACCMLLSGVQVSAKSLKDSFSGGSTYACTSYNAIFKMYTYQKTTYAQTEGYNGKHYVRAYMGGSSSSPSGAVVDSGRKWSEGNVRAAVSRTASIAESDIVFLQLYFPTGYAKYGK